MKVLITGGAGFIGSRTAKYISKKGNKVVVLDNFSTGRIENLQGFHGEIVESDITDFKYSSNALKGYDPEIVFHFAAQSAITNSWKNPAEDFNINGVGTASVISLCHLFDVKKLIFASSSAVYDETQRLFNKNLKETSKTNPSNPYGISKLAAEQLIRATFPNHVILRYGNVYGPGQMPIGENQVIAKIFEHFLKSKAFRITGHGKQKRDFVYIRDIVKLNYRSMINLTRGTFNAATGKSYSVNHVANRIAKCFGKYDYDFVHSEGCDPRGDVYINVSKIYEKMNWKSETSLSLGISMTHGWWENER